MEKTKSLLGTFFMVIAAAIFGMLTIGCGGKSAQTEPEHPASEHPAEHPEGEGDEASADEHHAEHPEGEAGEEHTSEHPE